ncbi:PREDICTED: uncharacterized protein LOC106783840 [Polistes canadensis]|uniref:uncharacterized protein LOC106783840 n=1 Tax=Polistes canadensis TaxID=91411 RepID=UPI000718CB9F|nr:PREDICTED: uncharacterized protein LOC106783840 [Polistes canadensis]
MRTLMEHQLSWFALLMTAFYSLLASCRGEECGHEELTRCARPLKKISNNNDLSFVTKKEDLQELCPDIQAGMKCIKTYTVKCMEADQREHFNSLYTGTNQAIMELCQDGPYQDEYLRHAPCMHHAKKDYDRCYKRYERTTQEIERENRTSGPNGSLKSVCCAFKEYLECSHHTVRRQCGDDTARFTKEFLDRMSNSLLKMHCASFSHEECIAIYSGAGRTWNNVELIVPLMFVFLARYFT